jgi:hypothetical protein
MMMTRGALTTTETYNYMYTLMMDMNMNMNNDQWKMIQVSHHPLPVSCLLLISFTHSHGSSQKGV